ncbi:MAG TPA: hypothetical protein VFE23_15295 [Usitatibacter sp.]|jgi:hypothetical protein|nr:hypothetical protein [Usitatibacter sp.]
MESKHNEAAGAVTVTLTRPMLYGMTAAFMALVGSVFWTAGYAAGLHGAGLLATLFAMGATTALLALVLWFLGRLRTLDASARDGVAGRR